MLPGQEEFASWCDVLCMMYHPVIAWPCSQDPRQTAYLAISLVAAHRGVRHAPLSLMASHAHHCLAAVLSSDPLPTWQQQQQQPQAPQDAAADGAPGAEPSGSGGGAPQGHLAPPPPPGAQRAARFACGVLACLPPPLLAALAPPLLLDPLAALLGSPAAAHALLLSAAESPAGGAAPRDPEQGLPAAARTALHHLGFALGVREWQEDWRARARRHQREDLLQRSRQRQQHHELPAGGGAAAAPALPAGQANLAVAAGEEGARERHMAVAGPPPPPLPLQQQQVVVEGPQDRAAAAEREERCRALVERVRHDEFGVGLLEEHARLQQQRQGGGAGQAAAEGEEGVPGVLRAQTERMGRALKRLSDELYSRDTHFVLELVQVRSCRRRRRHIRRRARQLTCALPLPPDARSCCVAQRWNASWTGQRGGCEEKIVRMTLRAVRAARAHAQNADDNAYAPGVAPTLEFVLEPRCVTVLNNEVCACVDAAKPDVGR